MPKSFPIYRFLPLLLVVLVLTGCLGLGTKRARPRGFNPDGVIRDVPAVLRTTIGAQATLRGNNPILVTGYGLVVNLDGTGSSDTPAGLRSFMEREMTLKGVGQETRGFGSVSPAQLLDDPNTAVVLVQAAIPPGSRAGTTFDILVEALPGTSTTSLEGGLLWTTDLQPGVAIPNGPAVTHIAQARGRLFINPFADPAQAGQDSIVRTSGRILSGGMVTRDQLLALVLDSPSHARARSLTNAVNTYFPRGTMDREKTARGRNEEIVELTIPYRYMHNTKEFIQLLLHSRTDQMFARDWAVRFQRALLSEPGLAEDLSWSLQALGEPALPALRTLYEFPEIRPRMAALRAGARLKDPLTFPHLKDVASKGEPNFRIQAISLMGDLDPDPDINTFLRTLINDKAADIRIAAYEALASRFEPSLESTFIEGKFRLDSIPADEPLIFITQQGEPRIVVFGENPLLERPSFSSAWEDRLMLTAETEESPVRLYYRDHRTSRNSTHIVDTRIPRFIEFLAHKTTPESPSPGLGLTYSEVVGALHELWKDGAIAGGFIAEQDLAAAELLRALTPSAIIDRPDFASQPSDGAQEGQQPSQPFQTSPIIPIAPRPDDDPPSSM
jgi:flagellar P-ring protein FlgI